MTQRARAIYENGVLRLLDNLHLREGEQVSIHVIGSPKPVRDQIKHLMLEIPDSGDEILDESVLFAEMDNASRGVSLSDILTEDRERCEGVLAAAYMAQSEHLLEAI